MEANIPKDYQQTTIKLIPENWEVKNLANIIIAGPKNGYSGRSGRDSRGTLTLRLTATSSGYLILNDETVKRLDETINPSSDLFLQPGDVLIQRSNTYELVGTTAIFDGPPRTYIYPDLMMRLRFEDQSTAHWFWRYANSFSGRRFFLSVAAGSTGSMPKISGEKLRGMTIPIPPPPEQKAIALCLSDTDALIAACDRAITKKRNIKQGAMQQLLTSKKRLPGFSGEWEVKKLGELLKVRHGKSQHNVVDQNGEFPVLATGGEIGRAKTYLYDKPSVLIGRKGTIDIPQYMDIPFWTIDTLFYTEILINAFPKFIFYRFNLINWYSYNEASGVPSLNAKTIEDIEVHSPPFPEQKAIAQILSDMDAEIAALEKKRDKYKAIKQGMMQELLTGKTRLIDR